MADLGSTCVLVYDVGGSHISAAICSGPDYRLGPVAQAHHPQEQSSNAFLDVLTQQAAQVGASRSCVAGASLAMPGPFDYETGVSWMRHKMPYLYGTNLGHALAKRLGWKDGQVQFLNDAAAFLWGELGAGAARGVTRAVGITLGTGVGSAFAANGCVQTSGPGIPPGGEIWNLPFEGGIVEDMISTRALKKNYRQATGRDREVADIAAGASGDPVAEEVFAHFGADLGRVLRTLFAEFAPEIVVLGGGIARSAQLFLPAAENALQGFPVQLRVSSLGDRAPLIGACVDWFVRSAQKTSGGHEVSGHDLSRAEESASKLQGA
ncbi:MAG: ROK family protein [Terracidiphilus sp.]